MQEHEPTAAERLAALGAAGDPSATGEADEPFAEQLFELGLADLDAAIDLFKQITGLDGEEHVEFCREIVPELLDIRAGVARAHRIETMRRRAEARRRQRLRSRPRRPRGRVGARRAAGIRSGNDPGDSDPEPAKGGAA